MIVHGVGEFHCPECKALHAVRGDVSDVPQTRDDMGFYEFVTAFPMLCSICGRIFNDDETESVYEEILNTFTADVGQYGD